MGIQCYVYLVFGIKATLSKAICNRVHRFKILEGWPGVHIQSPEDWDCPEDKDAPVDTLITCEDAMIRLGEEPWCKALGTKFEFHNATSEDMEYIDPAIIQKIYHNYSQSLIDGYCTVVRNRPPGNKWLPDWYVLETAG